MAVANKLDKLLPIAKRILRYLAGAQTFGLIYPLSDSTDLVISSQVDSDFACRRHHKTLYFLPLHLLRQMLSKLQHQTTKICSY